MKSNTFYKISWVLLILYVVSRIILGVTQGGIILRIFPFIGVALLFGFSSLHGVKRYGFKNLLVFFVVTCVVSWLLEDCSVITGFPFGHYYYSNALGIKIGHVPIYIMFQYFAMGYISWTLAHILLDKVDTSVKGKYIFLIPLISAFIMTSWDVCMDPTSSTISNQWIWKHGGAYFGVPFSNFVGWFLCVYIIYQIFAVYLSSKKLSKSITNKMFWIMPSLMYISVVLNVPLKVLRANNYQVTSLDNHIWWTGDIYFSMLLVVIFTMLFTTILCLIKIFNWPNRI